ncbi:MAG: NADH:flavin oxidoreductase/NADH oxidase [Rhodobiaceae bacterium]|jgi:2,4-dienoyl-CoA reductase-like NADH-dependent reductase (Old Yellow Enzyme family)|nr:NADH:flavin oxidoreductase/NADH oxidase [Rhodobiaceae bacterium]MBT6222795.1 NADH:flavin oxidoreductase/NADH oxidase [Rhodobiaceae bacterium]
MGKQALFSPISIKSKTFRNRVIMSPMCQYSSINGHLNDWHMQHYSRFAFSGLGGAFVEATGISPEGRITHGCAGIWSDDHLDNLKKVANTFKSYNCIAGIQLAHAGRKASTERPMDGAKSIKDNVNEPSWQTYGPSAIPVDSGSPIPLEMNDSDIKKVINDFKIAAFRADKAGFDMIELHGAHGYLLHSFLSPLSNKRSDGYGGSFYNRIKIIEDVVREVKLVWPQDKPIFYRVSSVDGAEGGTSWEENIKLISFLKSLGVDVIDCSSGGIGGSPVLAKSKIIPGFQVPYAEKIKKDTGIRTMAVGAIIGYEQANNIIQKGRADFVALGRELMSETQWVYNAAKFLGLKNSKDFLTPNYAFYLQRRDSQLDRDAEPL